MILERAVVELNGGCNYTCAMCPQSTGRGSNWTKQLTLEMLDIILYQLMNTGCKVVNLEGSGEPSTYPHLSEAIKMVRKHAMDPYIFTNGLHFKGDKMKASIDAGLKHVRFSIIGYNKETYKKWMNKDKFDQVVENLNRTQEYIARSGSDCILSTYHLILNNDDIDNEITQYLNIVESAGIKTEIWQMHNWAGSYDVERVRSGETKTCGRPFSPDIVIRAGGLSDEKWGAVHPCCQVLGRDDDAVLGHVVDNRISEIYNGLEYNKLRQDHRDGNYPDYCKSCDFLIDDPEVLVFTNYDRDLYKMLGTTFNLRDYQNG